MMAGGASLAPRRWSLAAPHTDTRSSSGYLATARMTATQKTRNWALSCGVSPGLSRFSPVSVDIDQLLCLPEPLMPANGFSWNSATRPYFGAVRRMTSIVSMLVVGGEVGVLEDRRDLVLAGGDLVVPGLDRHAQLEQLRLEVGHAGDDALGDGAEVLVLQLLALGRRGAEEGAAGVDQVGPRVVEVLVDQEVFLLRADGGEDLAGRRCCRTAAGCAGPAWTAPPSSAAAASSCRAPRRSS